MAQIIRISQDEALTMNALRGSIAFYKENNSDGRYNRALQKEEKMLKQYMDRIKHPMEMAA